MVTVVGTGGSVESHAAARTTNRVHRGARLMRGRGSRMLRSGHEGRHGNRVLPGVPTVAAPLASISKTLGSGFRGNDDQEDAPSSGSGRRAGLQERGPATTLLPQAPALLGADSPKQNARLADPRASGFLAKRTGAYRDVA